MEKFSGMEKREFKNYVLLQKINEGGKIEIIREGKDETSPEVGFKVSGVATTFNVRNENGGIFKSGDFDKTIREYFKKNNLNMLCPIEHSYNFENRGIFEFVENTAETLNVSAIFYKDSCRDYEVIKNQVRRGMLQGFSTFGWIFDNGEVFLENISLVGNPADTGAKIYKNTKFIGFDEPDESEGIERIKNQIDLLL